jgi:hypothetical protein
VVGGKRAGEVMGGTRGLTGGPGLPAEERRERERGGAADGWGRPVSESGAREGSAADGWGGARPRPRGGGRVFPFFLFLFSISHFYSISISFSFYLFFF